MPSFYDRYLAVAALWANRPLTERYYWIEEWMTTGEIRDPFNDDMYLLHLRDLQSAAAGIAAAVRRLDTIQLPVILKPDTKTVYDLLKEDDL